jgi:hypothetical protein
VATVAFQPTGWRCSLRYESPVTPFRDAYAAGQHFLVSQSSYRELGQFKLHQPDANPML